MRLIELVLGAGPSVGSALLAACVVVVLLGAALVEIRRAQRFFEPVRALARATATSALPSAPSDDVVLEGRLEHDDDAVVIALDSGRPCAVTTALAHVGRGAVIAHAAATGLRIVLDDEGSVPLVGPTEAVWSTRERVHAPLLRGARRARVDGALVADAVPFERTPVTLRSIVRGTRVRVRGRLRAADATAGYRGAPALVLDLRAGDRAIPIAPRIRRPRLRFLPIVALPSLAALCFVALTGGAAQLALADATAGAEPRWDDEVEPDPWVRIGRRTYEPYVPGTIEAIALLSPWRHPVLETIRTRVQRSVRTAAVVAAERTLEVDRDCTGDLLFLQAHGLDEELIELAPWCDSRLAAQLEVTALRRLARLDEAAVVAREGMDVPALLAVRTLLEAGDRDGALEVAHARLSEHSALACIDHASQGTGPCAPVSEAQALERATADEYVTHLASQMRGFSDVFLGHPRACDALCRSALSAPHVGVVPPVGADGEEPVLFDRPPPFADQPRVALVALRARELLLEDRTDHALRLVRTEPMLEAEAALVIEAFGGDAHRVAELLPAAHLDDRTTARIAGLAIARLGGSLDPLAESLHDYPPHMAYRGCMFGWEDRPVPPPDSRFALLAGGDRRSGRAVAEALGDDVPTIGLVLAARAITRGHGELAEHLRHSVEGLSGNESIAALYSRGLVLRATADAIGDRAWRDALDARLAIWSAVLDRAEDAVLLRALDDALMPAEDEEGTRSAR